MTNHVNYFEIGTPDPETARAFYGDTFGWDFGPASPGDYRMIDGAGAGGGLWDSSGAGGDTWAVFYVEVDDIHATAALATAHGADTVIPLVDNGTILFTHLRDPLGNRFGLWQRKTHG